MDHEIIYIAINLLLFKVPYLRNKYRVNPPKYKLNRFRSFLVECNEHKHKNKNKSVKR